MTKVKRQTVPNSILEPGNRAPDFTLKSNIDEISLSALRGKAVILVFYPGDWTSVCGDQLALYNEVLLLFEEQGAQLLGISVDSAASHRAYAESRNLTFPLLADFEPKGEVARAYGVYDHEKGTTERALFVIDAEGTIQWSYLSPRGTNPGADGILRALEGLKSSEVKANGK